MGDLILLPAGEGAYQDITDRLAIARHAWVYHDGRLEQHLREVPRQAVARTGPTNQEVLLHELVRLGGGIRPVQERLGSVEVPVADPGLVVIAPGDGLLPGTEPRPEVADVLRFLSTRRDVVVVLDQPDAGSYLFQVAQPKAAPEPPAHR